VTMPNNATSVPAASPSPEPGPRRFRRLTRRQWVWTALFAVALAVLVFLLVLVGVGYLRLPSSSSSKPSVTVTAVDWTVEQGTNGHGVGWFGKNQFNYTGATGWFPPTFAAGSQLQVSWSISNFDNVNHTIYSVSVGAPFSLDHTLPVLPMTVFVGDDGNTLGIWVTTSSSTSGSYVLDITVDALSAG
jgi:hypothetical protein